MRDEPKDLPGDLGHVPDLEPFSDEPCVILRRTRRPWGRRSRLLFRVGAGLSVVLLVLAGCAGLFFARLAEGPIGVDGLGTAVASALTSRVGRSYHFDLGKMAIEDSGEGPRLSVAGFAMKGEAGRPIIAAPKAEVSLDPLSLMFGSVSPKRVEVYDVEVRLSVMPDGAVAISAGTEPILLTRSLMASGDGVAAEAPVLEPVAENSGVESRIRNGDAVHRIGLALKSLLDSATGPDSPLGVLERVGISRGRLVFDDRTTHQTTVFDGFELAFDKTSGGVHLKISARGPNGRWMVEGTTEGKPGEKQTLDLDFRDLTFDEISLIAGLRDPGFDFDMPMSSRVQVELAEDGKLSRAEGHFGIGAGFFFLHDPDHEPVQIDEITGRFRWNAESRRFDLDTTNFHAGETHFIVGGSIVPPETPDRHWRIEGKTLAKSVFGVERPNQKAIDVEAATFSAHIVPDERKLVVDKLDLHGPELDFAMKGEGWLADDGPHLRMNASAGRMPASSVVRLWPSPVAAPVRAWFIHNLKGGILEQASLRLDFGPDAIASIRRNTAPPDDSVRLDFTLSNASASVLDGIPLLSALDGVGVVTGRTSSFVATRGQMEVSPNQSINLVEGSFSVPDADVRPTPAAINLRMTGSLDTLANLFDREALKPYVQLPIDSTTVKGHVDGRLAIDLKLGPNTTPEDTSMRASATLTDFSVERLVGKEKLDAATLDLTAERGTLHAVGQGRMFGAPATIELKKSVGAPSEAIIGMTLDDAARSKLGMNLGSSLTGAVGAKMTAVLGQTDKVRAQVEIDFSRAAIDNLLPGYTKPSGRPAKASFQLVSDPHGLDLDQFVFEGGSAFAKGSMKLDANGTFLSAKLPQVRLSPGDEMRVDAEQTKDALKIGLRGNVVDARPLLKLVSTGVEGPAARDRGASDLDLDLKAGIVTGNNKQALSGVDLKISRRNGVIRQFHLNGKIGGEPVVGTTNRPANGGQPQVQITTNDGGSLLSFFDLYRRMEGGKLLFAAQIVGGKVQGLISVRDFIVRNEPALRRLVTEGVAARDRSGRIKIDTTAAAFTKMQVNFSRSDGRIELRDGVIYGKQVGTTMEGWIDTANDRVSMTGTFVPAYGLNNLFSKIPIFGIILGGGSNEGLFGVNYRISGPASAPVLTINPLSAIAPGFLRKIFGAGEVGTSQFPQPETGPPPLELAPAR